jgi:RNA polymerase sigma-70 factor (ECF subfamily)
MTDWSQIVGQHGPIVWKTVYRLLDHEADAADCFQNAFVSALELSRKEAVRNWPGLLRRLATARALERLRQRYRESGRLSTLADRSTVDTKAVEPGRAAQASELAEDLRAALAELDTRQAEVFCLACLEGLSYRQIAGQLGVTVNHVGVLLSRGRSSLRERLRAHGPPATAERLDQEIQP